MKHHIVDNIWDAISDTAAEAENMKLRSALMMAIHDRIRAKGWTQSEAARQLLEALVNLSVAAGLRIELHAQQAA